MESEKGHGTIVTPDEHTRWPSRPQCTPSQEIDFEDYEGPRHALEESKDLFQSDGTVKLVACQMNEHVKFKIKPILSQKELEVYVDKHYNQDLGSIEAGSQYFLLDQLHTKAPLNITKAALSTLLNRINALPKLAHILTAFTSDEQPCHEGRSGFHVPLTHGNNAPLELCMILKYVELNGNPSDPIPWSVRQMAIYQHHDRSNNRESVLLIRASDSLRRRIQEELQESSQQPKPWSHWTNLPLLTISSLTENWTEYFRFLDKKVWAIDKTSRFTDPFSERIGEVNFRDLQASQSYMDLLLRAEHVMRSNVSVLKALVAEAESRKLYEPNDEEGRSYLLLKEIIESTIREIQFLMGHAELIRLRLANIRETIRDCIQSRTSHHSAQESSSMRILTVKTIREARTVKTIALMTLLFLPATFTTGFLDSALIHASITTTKGLVVTPTPELYFWLAITLPLMAVTLGGWWGWEYLSRRRLDGRTAEDGSMGMERMV